MALRFPKIKPLYSTKNLSKIIRNSSTITTTTYCIDLVRKLDYENYLCCLLIHKNSRRSVFALRAFNIELAKIIDSTSVDSIGKMKLQFWKDAIDCIYTKKHLPEHPVVSEVAKAINQHNLSKIWFTKLLDGRDTFNNRPFITQEKLEENAEKTVSSLLYLTLETLGMKDTNADHCASHIGKAIGIATILRSTAYHVQFRRVLWPMDIMVQHHIPEEDILRGKNTPAIKEAVYELASSAHIHLTKARSLNKDMSSKTSRAWLTAVPCDSYLKLLQQVDFNVFHTRLQQRNTLLPLILLKNAWLKTF